MNRAEQLIARASEGDLGEEEIAELCRYLEEDSDLRAVLCEQASLHGWLGPVLEDEARGIQFTKDCIDAVRAADRERFVKVVDRKILSIRLKRRTMLAAAAVATLVIGLSLWIRAPQPVATIVGIGALQADSPLGVGDGLNEGERFQFEAGLVEVDLDGRGRMIVEGPVDIRFTGRMNSSLAKGRVLVRVNEKGRGYRLETPKGAVVDLGTEFGVVIDEKSGEVETHVLKGEVEAVSRSGAEKVLLKKDEALRQTNVRNVSIPADEASFYASLPPAHGGGISMIHWPMGLASGGIVPARTQGFGNEAFDLVFRAGIAGGLPDPVDGVFGSAVHFDGTGVFAESPFRGIGGAKPRTVAFWVKVPQDFALNQGFAMVSWGEFSEEDPGSVWQVSVNPLKEDGPIGRLRVGVHGGKAIGSTDLRDDQWHHIAVVLYPAADPDFGQHVMLFIDGAPERVSRRVLGKIDTVVEKSTHGVWMGRDVTSSVPEGRFFRGALDEVYIFSAALSQDEIRKLMERNEAPD